MMTTQPKIKPHYPTHIIYAVNPKGSQDKSDWFKVGAAWEHGDQKGLNLKINLAALSLNHMGGPDATLVIRRDKFKTD
ncbi:hypothetical protein [Spirosoma foliorum]|uniref:Uncharacterized protein n=1 Tax=Spirosoma foliorum TaxID=2710596 RepID=A0A7G5H2W9_9BACT|nr:hypothetical protein [Spirosoma foliorum]QMW05461.1 hypothetical protein H3H32_11510 [Spirosoma foliorum]